MRRKTKRCVCYHFCTRGRCKVMKYFLVENDQLIQHCGLMIVAQKVMTLCPRKYWFRHQNVFFCHFRIWYWYHFIIMYIDILITPCYSNPLNTLTSLAVLNIIWCMALFEYLCNNYGTFFQLRWMFTVVCRTFPVIVWKVWKIIVIVAIGLNVPWIDIQGYSPTATLTKQSDKEGLHVSIPNVFFYCKDRCQHTLVS